MPTDDRNSSSSKPSDNKKDEKVSDLPARDATGKDDKVKGGMPPYKTK